MTFKKLSIISNSIALLVSLATVASVWSAPAFAAGCDPDIYFSITDPVTGNIVTQAPQNGKVTFYVKLTPKGDCSTTVINDVVINQRLTNGITFLANFPISDKNGLRRGVVESKYTQGVDGILDTTTGKPVQVGGKLSLEGAVKLEGEDKYRNSSPTPLAAVAAVPGGGGGDVNAPNVNTPGGNVNTPGGDPSTVGTIGTISNPIGYESLGALVVAIIRFLLTMIGGLAVLFIIIGAVRMVTSQGNEKAVTAGKQTVTWAVIGLITALMAFSLISLVQSLIGRK